MAKVLLVLENYTELAYCETLLKKVGVDVQGCQNDMSVSEFILTFMPDLVIANAQGRKVNGLRVAGKLLHAPYPTTLVLLAGDVSTISDDDQRNFNISAVLSTPVEPQSFLGTVAKLLNLDVAAVLKKSGRSFDSSADKSKQWVKSTEILEQIMENSAEAVSPDLNIAPTAAPFSIAQIEPETARAPSITATEAVAMERERARQKRYQRAIEQLPEATQNGLTRSLVSDQIKDFRRTENDPEVAAIDAERTKFTLTLFKQAAEATQAAEEKASAEARQSNSGVRADMDEE